MISSVVYIKTAVQCLYMRRCRFGTKVVMWAWQFLVPNSRRCAYKHWTACLPTQWWQSTVMRDMRIVMH